MTAFRLKLRQSMESFVIAPLSRMISYIFRDFSNKKTLQKKHEALKTSLEELRGQKNDVENRVNFTEQRELQRMLEQVQSWMLKVAAVEADVDQVLKKGSQKIEKAWCGPQNYISSYRYTKKMAKKMDQVTELLSKAPVDEIKALLESQQRSFSEFAIRSITNNFTSVIGRGGFGKVCLGALNQTQVAVKLLSLSSSQGTKEFKNEVELLMRTHHRNVVSLMGYCNEGNTTALVYEYVANGNLERHLSDVTTNALTWKKRLQIAIDIARGLDYLHNGCKPAIIHRDLKTSNILLNDKMQAIIADFGISKALPSESATHVTTQPKGTLGYYNFRTNKLNKKGDVYSFGIVLLEIITGNRAIIRDDPEDDPIHISQWVKPRAERKEIESIVDSRIEATSYKRSSACKAIEIAMDCVFSTEMERPDIIPVYVKLMECLEIEMSCDQVLVDITDDIESDDTSPSSTTAPIQIHSICSY